MKKTRDNGIGTSKLKKIDTADITYVKIPEGLKSIKESNFENYKKLEYIEIPDSVKDIGERAFYGCVSLKFIIIPEGIRSIEDYTFTLCKSLESVKLPNSLTSIGNHAFRNCEKLKSIEIPEDVLSIGKSAFSDCKSLKSIEIPVSVTSIGYNAFSGCTSLKSIEIPGNVMSIEDRTFYNCQSLESINIPNSLTSIGDRAFRNCKKLNVIHMKFKDGKQIHFKKEHDNILYSPFEINNKIKKIVRRIFNVKKTNFTYYNRENKFLRNFEPREIKENILQYDGSEIILKKNISLNKQMSKKSVSPIVSSKRCPPGQTPQKVSYIRCINDKTMASKIRKELKKIISEASPYLFPNKKKRSPIRSSSSKYYTAKQSLSSSSTKKKNRPRNEIKKASPVKMRQNSFLDLIKKGNTLKKISPVKKQKSFLEQIKMKPNLKRVSPVKKQRSPIKTKLMEDILKGRDQLKKTNISPKKSFPKTGGGSLLDLMKNRIGNVRRKVGSSSSSNEDWE